MSQELRNRERRNNHSRLYLNRGYNLMYAGLYKYCSVPLVLSCLCFFLPLCRYHLMAVLRSICTPFSPADKATTSRKQLDPSPSQLSHKKEKRKKKKKNKIHNAETITRKIFTDPNCMFCFCVSMQLHISNTEHVQCACNDYKLQELTFKCLNLYFCESY